MLPANNFRYFYEVAQCGSIRQAAEQLHISPSAISRMIKQLEHRFRTPLFERHASGMRLTVAGKLLSDQLNSIYAQIRDVEMSIDDMHGLRRGEVSLHCIEAVMPHLAPGFLTRFHHAHPNITFSVNYGSTEDIVAALLAYTADIGITFNMPKKAGIEVLKTFEYPLFALVAPGHPLASKPQVSLSEAVQYKMAMPNKSFGVRQIFERALRQCSAKAAMLINTNSLIFARSIACTGVAITFSSLYVARAELTASQLVAVPVVESKLLRGKTTICKHSERQLSASARGLLTYIEESFDDQGAHL